ncbi:HypC/HybG/HupF family hydrogenase formation chaperone [Nocardioides cynanchi]|uniref:HypC/HybG/HupF family hydrogenase formation chaperone n=1 Tax=Nocardioides cynanchi TaxID=2558918 RepID=UPI0012490F35|nr:HypC/HybG/HupF family hydrogenase formation chaperone [Nocardioides cynanchi]
MCLGELVEVVAVAGATAEVTRSDGRRGTVSLMALGEPVAVADWLVVHAGFALDRITHDEAQEAARIRGSR